MSISYLGECATPKCTNNARWLPIPLANKVGHNCPRFCDNCTEAINLAFQVLDAARNEARMRADAARVTDNGWNIQCPPQREVSLAATDNVVVCDSKIGKAES